MLKRDSLDSSVPSAALVVESWLRNCGERKCAQNAVAMIERSMKTLGCNSEARVKPA